MWRCVGQRLDRSVDLTHKQKHKSCRAMHVMECKQTSSSAHLEVLVLHIGSTGELSKAMGMFVVETCSFSNDNLCISVVHSFA